MKNYSTSKVFMAACAGMAFFGVTMLSLAPILGPLNETVQGANALPSTMSIGIIVGTILFVMNEVTTAQDKKIKDLEQRVAELEKHLRGKHL